MKYCKKCLMPDTRPGISFNEEGVCLACQNHEKRKKINWEERWEELKNCVINTEELMERENMIVL